MADAISLDDERKAEFIIPRMRTRIAVCIVALACMYVFPACSSTSSGEHACRAAQKIPEDVVMKVELPRTYAKHFQNAEKRAEMMQSVFRKRPRIFGTPFGALAGLHSAGPKTVYSMWDLGKRSGDRLMVYGTVCFSSYPSVNVWPVLSVPLEPRFTEYSVKAEVRFID